VRLMLPRNMPSAHHCLKLAMTGIPACSWSQSVSAVSAARHPK